MATRQINADFPPKLRFLFSPSRYKVAYGGRGGTKSWGFARALLVQGLARPLRILCARETMESLAQSVHQLLRDQIEALSLGADYEVQKASIIGRNGTLFTFAGLAHNVANIKSLESYDIVWVEEAQSVSKDSWQTLIPTIRKAGSEIWVSFNPILATDETYKRFVLNPPPNACVVQVGWRDNPWFPKVLEDERRYLKSTDPDAYEHIWEGATRSTVEGAIYKTEIYLAEQQGRFCRVPYEPARPVETYWDLGYADMVAIWFAQAVGFEYRIIDYYESSYKSIDHYIGVLQSKGYTLGTCVLPWDGGAPSLGTGRSIRELLQTKGFSVRVLPQIRVVDGINAVRTIFHQCWFDAEKCADGISGLRRYQWGEMPKDGTGKREPLHDAASHPADAFRSLAVHIKTPEQEELQPQYQRPVNNYGPNAWMA